VIGIHLTQDEEEKEEVKEKLTRRLTTLNNKKIVPLSFKTSKEIAEEKKKNEMQSKDGENDKK